MRRAKEKRGGREGGGAQGRGGGGERWRRVGKWRRSSSKREEMGGNGRLEVGGGGGRPRLSHHPREGVDESGQVEEAPRLRLAERGEQLVPRVQAHLVELAREGLLPVEGEYGEGELAHQSQRAGHPARRLGGARGALCCLVARLGISSEVAGRSRLLGRFQVRGIVPDGCCKCPVS